MGVVRSIGYFYCILSCLKNIGSDTEFTGDVEGFGLLFKVFEVGEAMEPGLEVGDRCGLEPCLGCLEGNRGRLGVQEDLIKANGKPGALKSRNLPEGAEDVASFGF